MYVSLTTMLRDMRERGLENVFHRFYALYRAKVSRTDDPQQRARASIIPDSLGFSDEFAYADFVTPFASDDAGFYFPPYDGDNVIVTFDHGDISSPFIVGGWWRTRGNKRVSDTGLPAEFVSSTNNASGEQIGATPTTRGIKVKVGSGLLFDETTDKTRADFWTGRSNGIGHRATKLNWLGLDSTTEKGQVFLATYGDKNPNAESVTDSDPIDEINRKELDSRLRHRLLMRDDAGDRFIQIKTIGKDAVKYFHQILLSDTEKKVVINTTDGHFFEINDLDARSEWSLTDGFKWVIDQAAKKIFGETPSGRKITFDDAGQFSRIETPDAQKIELAATGTTIEDASLDIDVRSGASVRIESVSDTSITSGGGHNVTATGPSTHSYLSALTTSVVGAWTHSVVGAAVIQAVGTLLIQAANISLTSATVILGSGTPYPLVNLQGMNKYNAHTHVVVGPFPGLAVQTTSQMIQGQDTTAATTAA